MIINDINILTSYGFKLQTISGHLSLPERKKVLQEQAYGANDIKKEQQRITVKLLGSYASKSLLATAVSNLKALLTQTGTLYVTISEHNLDPFLAVVRDGVQVELFNSLAQVTIIFRTTWAGS